MAKLCSKSLCILLNATFVLIFSIYASKSSFISTSTNHYNPQLKKDLDSHQASFLNASNILSDVNRTDIYRTPQLWLIRHAERLDEVYSNNSQYWAKHTSSYRLFDPPLTQNGLKQATERGKILLKHLSKYKNNKTYENYYPKYIYSSPTQRTIATAMKIAEVLNLPVKIIPGLSECAAAVKKGRLLKHNLELYLKRCRFIRATFLIHCRFLTKQEIVKRFGKNGVKISFDYEYLDLFGTSVQRLVNNSKTNIILAVTHREGIKYLDDILQYSHIPYAKVAKYIFVPNSKIYPNGFQYFEDDGNEEVSKQIFHSPFSNNVIVSDNQNIGAQK